MFDDGGQIIGVIQFIPEFNHIYVNMSEGLSIVVSDLMVDGGLRSPPYALRWGTMEEKISRIEEINFQNQRRKEAEE